MKKLTHWFGPRKATPLEKRLFEEQNGKKVEWHPTNIEGLTAWIDASKPLRNKWGWPIGRSDLSGNGNHMPCNFGFWHGLKIWLMFWR